MYRLGAKPYKPDERDYLYRAALVVPTTVTRKYWSMVSPDFRLNQGQEGTCVGHAATNILLAGPTTHNYFPRFATVEDAHQFARQLYFEASGDPTYQVGMYPRDALDKLVAWSNLASYYRHSSVDETINALLTRGPVFFASPWYESMFSPYYPLKAGGTKAYVKVNPDSGLAGYHAYALTGIDLAPDKGPPFVRMENSWGPGWGNNGTARITIDNLHILYDGDSWWMTETTF